MALNQSHIFSRHKLQHLNLVWIHKYCALMTCTLLLPSRSTTQAFLRIVTLLETVGIYRHEHADARNNDQHVWILHVEMAARERAYMGPSSPGGFGLYSTHAYE